MFVCPWYLVLCIILTTSPDQPFSGNVVTFAAYTFIYRFMSNKSAEYPEGRLDKETLKSFFSITGPENNVCPPLTHYCGQSHLHLH